MRNLREAEGGERRELGGLQYDRVPRGEGWGDFPRDHQEREIPRHDLPHDSHRLVARELGVGELRPTRVMVQVTGDERDVQVARLADRLAIVQALEHRQEA